MELVNISGTDLMVSRVALGTWAIGGWMWGGTDEKQSIKTIHMALDKGINLIDTAPVYGFGLSEKIAGKAIKEYGNRDKINIATKVALEWKDGKVFRNSTPERIEKEVMASLERLQTDYIDIYFIHWPDSLVPFEKTAETMKKLLDDGVIRAIGVSNYSADQMNQFRKAAPIHVCQPPYNIFERQIEDNEKPYCHEHKITMMAYGALCRGLLSGKMSKNRAFKGDDLRKADPKFQGERFDQYLAAAEKIRKMADNQYGKDLLSTAIRWVLDQGIEIAIWGARTPEQLKPVDDIIGWSLNEADKSIIDDILVKTIKNPVGPEFMAPPERDINK